jgi:4'-phosphopantetheinyl transferase
MCFDTNKFGKIHLCCTGLGQASAALRFNISHSGALAVLAFVCAREVGVDVESVQAQIGTEEQAELMFMPSERALIRAGSLILQREACCKYWVSKEAYVKAIGTGLTTPLNSFNIAFQPRAHKFTVLSGKGCSEGRSWTGRNFYPYKDYIGALVLQGDDWDLKCFNWRSGDVTHEGTTE